MISGKNLAANKANSKVSSGTAIPTRKYSSQNATKHGLFSKHSFFCAEDQADFKAVLSLVEAQLRPATTLQSLAVADIAGCCVPSAIAHRLEARTSEALLARTRQRARRTAYGRGRRGPTTGAGRVVADPRQSEHLKEKILALQLRHIEDLIRISQQIAQTANSKPGDFSPRHFTATQRNLHRAITWFWTPKTLETQSNEPLQLDAVAIAAEQ